MKILKRFLQVISVLVGIAIIYFAIVAFTPVLKVPKQPLHETAQPLKKSDVKTSSLREDVTFSSGGASISAWLFLPKNLSAPVPCIIIAHGFGGTKAMGLDKYAVCFQDAGYAVLVFDYRYFGDSAGEPRQLLWIPYQLEDWVAAIKYARTLQQVDPKKIALWGTSFSGGHVIVTASKDEGIACVSAQCPGIDSHASGELFLEREGIRFILRMIMHGQRDIVRSWFGLSPHRIPIVGKAGTIAVMNTPDAYEFFAKHTPPNFNNEVCARITIRSENYRPIEYAQDVRCPVLLQICDYDNLIPKNAIEETAKRLGKYAEVKHYPIGHFDIYTGINFEGAVRDQLVFFKKHL